MNSETITLKYPITMNGVETTFISMRRPTVGDMLVSNSKGMSSQESEVRLLADLCSMAPDDMKKMDMADYISLQDVFAKMQDSDRNSSG